MSTKEEYDLIITPKKNLLDLNLKQVWNYRDLLFLFVKRDFISQFKQTILGPMWFVIQPVLQAVTMYVFFYLMAGLSTDGLPAILFYLSGNILWLFFSDCLNANANTFTTNANLFGKVYFPRLIVPISVVISNLLKFGVRLILFIAVFIYYMVSGFDISISPLIRLIVPLVILMGGYGLSLGLLFASLTTKYRDLKFLIGFGVQLLMYGSSVVIPLSMIPDEYKDLMRYNPFVNIIETFKFITMGKGEHSWFWLGYSFILLIALTFISIILFNRTEKSFIDTV